MKPRMAIKRPFKQIKFGRFQELYIHAFMLDLLEELLEFRDHISD